MEFALRGRISLYRLFIWIGLILLVARILLVLVPCGWIHVGPEPPHGFCLATLGFSMSVFFATLVWGFCGLICVASRVREEKSKAGLVSLLLVNGLLYLPILVFL